ncbi:DUF2953 domain-containing protein [Caldanaerobius polysaccharolyticus]|uniref:DUF2953 domain-containing protein n=1 Tax=Caldanaerobius polysaccharolyticus TaxID=44256 RepID=UPI00047DD696|nr:DUF2953 domain-containing protein [Caldanaerobius polysaccharolyticus]
MYVLVVLLVLIAIIFAPLRFNLTLMRLGDDDLVKISIDVYYIKVLRVEIDYVDLLAQKDHKGLRYNIILRYVFPILLNKSDKKQFSYDKIRKIIKDIVAFRFKYRRGIDYILENVTVKKFELSASVGLRDAAMTAIVTGALYALINSFLACASSYIKFTDMPLISIKPDFGRLNFELSITSIIATRLAQIIIGSFLILLGGMSYERTSNGWFDEDDHGKLKGYSRCQ